MHAERANVQVVVCPLMAHDFERAVVRRILDHHRRIGADTADGHDQRDDAQRVCLRFHLLDFAEA